MAYRRLSGVAEWEPVITARLGPPEKSGRDLAWKPCPVCSGKLVMFPRPEARDGVGFTCYPGNLKCGVRRVLNPDTGALPGSAESPPPFIHAPGSAPAPPLSLAPPADDNGGAEWHDHPALAPIRQWALSARIGPDALLASALAVVSAIAPVGMVLPGQAESAATSPLGVYTLICGPSAIGKSSVIDNALALLGADPAICTPNSGEGLLDRFGAHPVSGPDGIPTDVIGLANPALLVVLDEFSRVLEARERRGDATWSYLRSGWSGKELRADVARSGRHPVEPPYTLAAIAAGTWSMARRLMMMGETGDATRWLLVAGVGGVEKARPARPDPVALAPWPAVAGTVLIADSVADYIDDRRLEVANGLADHGHHYLVRLRVAAMLAWLCGDPGIVDPEHWRLAGAVMEGDRRARAMADEAGLADEVAQLEQAAGDAVAKAAKSMARTGRSAREACSGRWLSAFIDAGGDRDAMAVLVQDRYDRDRAAVNGK